MEVLQELRVLFPDKTLIAKEEIENGVYKDQF